MKKRIFALAAAVIFMTTLLGGCSERNKLDDLKEFLDPYLEKLFDEENSDNSDNTGSGDDKDNSKDGFMLADIFIPYSVEKLVISGRDSVTLSWLAEDLFPDDCAVITPRSDLDSSRLNLGLIAENLPNLKELHLYQANVWNREAIAEMKNLEVLTYYVYDNTQTEGFIEAYADCPFKELKNLRTLRIYGKYDDYSFLNEMPWLEDIHVEFNDSGSGGGQKKIFGCPGITSLKLDNMALQSEFDIKGIEKLTKLKKLEISCQVLDFAPLGKLKNLEDLHIRCSYNALNVSELAKASKLKKLFLSDLKTKDWKFLKQLKELTDLSLYYIPNVKNSDLAGLKQLKFLALSESGCDVAAVKNLPNLEVYTEIMSSGGDFSAFNNCLKLRELYLLGCEKGVMDFSYVQNCPLEVINCDGTEVTNVEMLANIKTLKTIYIATDEQNITCGDALRRALPDCEISVDQSAGFHNHF